MRYSLKQPNENGLISLQEEITHIQNLIRVYELRWPTYLYIQFTASSINDNVKIIPRILITLVENALKHGELHDAENPLELKFNLTNENKLYVYVNNKRRSGPKEIGTGLGLANIEKRLSMLYKGRYQYAVTENSRFYTTELSIDLNSE
jgi:LytS/YehU family sensor histidine kinase